MIRFFLCIIFLAISGVAPATENLTLILNSENTPGALPRNFRKINDLHASGSGQFSEDGLRCILSQLPSEQALVIIDLRQESHGFANGIAVSWYAPRDEANWGKTLAAIEADEIERLQELLKTKNIKIHRVIHKPEDVIEKSETIPLLVQTVATEKQLTEKYKLGYVRIPVPDHLAPSKEQVEKFENVIAALPPNCWLHIHCEAGHGRTTTFLAVYDIIRNGKKDSFEAILKRQHQLGGMDLEQMPSHNSWKYPFAVEREQFLKNFYTKFK